MNLYKCRGTLIKCMNYPVAEVRRNNSNGQKLLTVPKDSDIYPGDKVRLVNLGEHWESIPAHLKTHQNIRDLISLTVKSNQELDYGELEEVNVHLEEAGESLSKALDVIEENRAVYADVSTEELQENCRHDRIERGDEGWRCVECKKIIPLDL